MTKQNEAAKTGTEKQTTPAVQQEKTLADLVLNKVKVFTANRDIKLPDDYSPENALKSAWLILVETKDKNNNAALSVCTKDSIANALLNMVLQGLNPVKKQCDFLVYGDKLTLQREYHGTITLAKRYANVKEAVGMVIYEDDVFEYAIETNGYRKIIKHEQSLKNIDDNKIIGAYATLIFNGNQPPYVEIMTMAQIRQSWMQGPMKGNSPAHKNFAGEMAKKTVISRACKLFISSSDDSSLFDDDDRDERSAASKQVINDNANKEEITMDIPTQIVEEKKEVKAEQRHEPEMAETEQAGNLTDLGKTSKPGF